MLHNGTYIFTVSWNRQSSPQTIGILNADGTVAQTTVILLPNAKSDNTGKNTQNTNDKGKNNEKTNYGDNGSNIVNKQGGNSHSGEGGSNGNSNGTSDGSNNYGNKNR